MAKQLHRLVITYDVTHDKARRQIVKLLSQYGKRVQKSVFEFDLPKEQAIEMTAKLRRLFFKLQSARYHKGGMCLSVIVIPVCKACAETGFSLGSGSSDEREFMLV